MYVVSANTGLWRKGTNTAIRIEFTDEAKQEADAWSGAGEKVLDRCAWRLIAVEWNEVVGDSVCFTVSREQVLKLKLMIGDLLAIDGEPN